VHDSRLGLEEDATAHARYFLAGCAGKVPIHALALSNHGTSAAPASFPPTSGRVDERIWADDDALYALQQLVRRSC
jgi:hypothetical protein